MDKKDLRDIYIYVCVCVYMIIYVQIFIYTCAHTHAHTRILFSHEKEGNPAIVTTWMDLESIMLSEISKKEKDKYCM